MKNVIISCHGNMASGIKSAFELMLGSPSEFNLDCIDFASGKSAEQLKAEMQQLIKEGEDYLILVDILGGTPFKKAFELAIVNKNIKIITDVSFSMLVTIYDNHEASMQELIDLIFTNRNNVTKVFPA
ncbi:PTS sugar transporter subunit IIA [Rickettsiales bacterium LUAb2]